MVYIPLHESAVIDSTFLRKMEENYTHFSQKYGFPIIDLREDPITKDSTMFIDATHLNENGCSALTDTLANRLKNLMM